ncbi:hypothetical protein PAPYR_7926 [Paratrimastix pyriformis]|uniref:Uncharacterized protein n=1 Tax=Paratrimastix pyriformis TaxID=342808 RepID=A0ABQ8UJ05_9EUKA|nr:hypothetical protein PAPYR_7926 [Paratrimastix pyriformis]
MIESERPPSIESERPPRTMAQVLPSFAHFFAGFCRSSPGNMGRWSMRCSLRHAVSCGQRDGLCRAGGAGERWQAVSLLHLTRWCSAPIPTRAKESEFDKILTVNKMAPSEVLEIEGSAQVAPKPAPTTLTKWNARSPQAHDILVECDKAIRKAYPGSWLFAPAMTAGKVRPEIEHIVPSDMMDDFISYLNNTRPQGIIFRRGPYSVHQWIESVERLGNTRHRPPKWYLDFLRSTTSKQEAASIPASPASPQDSVDTTDPGDRIKMNFLRLPAPTPEKADAEAAAVFRRPWM